MFPLIRFLSRPHLTPQLALYPPADTTPDHIASLSVALRWADGFNDFSTITPLKQAATMDLPLGKGQGCFRTREFVLSSPGNKSNVAVKIIIIIIIKKSQAATVADGHKSWVSNKRTPLPLS